MNCATRCKHNAPGRGCTLFKGRSWLQCRRATTTETKHKKSTSK